MCKIIGLGALTSPVAGSRHDRPRKTTSESIAWWPLPDMRRMT
jgi:hypothetical protein